MCSKQPIVVQKAPSSALNIGGRKSRANHNAIAVRLTAKAQTITAAQGREPFTCTTAAAVA